MVPEARNWIIYSEFQSVIFRELVQMVPTSRNWIFYSQLQSVIFQGTGIDGSYGQELDYLFKVPICYFLGNWYRWFLQPETRLSIWSSNLSFFRELVQMVPTARNQTIYSEFQSVILQGTGIDGSYGQELDYLFGVPICNTWRHQEIIKYQSNQKYFSGLT